MGGCARSAERVTRRANNQNDVTRRESGYGDWRSLLPCHAPLLRHKAQDNGTQTATTNRYLAL